ncbi:MAG: sugar kinase [Cyclobacteriaceae bacterium]
MKKVRSVVTFGEIMLRLTPSQNHQRLVKTGELILGYAGAESNVAIAMAQWDHDISFVSQLPDNSLGDGAVNLMREFGIHTEHVIREGARIGIYFIENGASIRPSKVLYDRDNSAIQNLKEGAIDWEKVLEGKHWIHLTGITPALSTSCANETIKAAKVAKKLGVKVSFDLNFRRKLWQNRDAAREIFDQILVNTDVLLANEGSLKDVYDMESSKTSGKERCEELMPLAQEKFGVDEVAFTIRKHTSASQNEWGGIIYDGTGFHYSNSFDLQIIDRFGGGDAFAAGLIHGYVKDWDFKKTIDFAVAASALQQTMPGDLCLLSEAEVNTVVDGHISGHVER